MLPSPTPPPSRPARRGALWLAGALVVALLAVALAAVAVRRGGGEDAEVGAAPPPAPAGPGATAAPPDGPAAPPVPPALRKAFEELQAQTAEIRRLQWKGPLDLRVVSRPELARRVREVIARDTDPRQVAGEEATLKLLGLIPAEVDYEKLVTDLLAEQVLGFYDPITRQLVVGRDGDGELDGVTRWVIVHEMVHALTDQVFNYGPTTDALYRADKADEAAAYSALLEGDAVLVQTQWAERHLSAEELLLIALGGGGAAIDVLTRVPEYVRQDLVFPYESGTTFVRGLFDAGGFAAVDAAYRRPPTTTEQILHPETYRAGQAAATPPLPDLAAATGCAGLRTGTLGQFDMQATLGRHLSSAEAERAVGGWSGDAYGVVRCGGALGLAGRWDSDTPADATRLAEAAGRWAARWSGSGRGPGPDGRFSGPAGAGRITRAGSRVEVVLAQDGPTADRLVAALSA